MVFRNAMKKYIQPNMYRLLRNGSRDEYRLTDRAEEIAWELHKVLSVFDPCGDDDNRSIWLEVPRGEISDWMTYEEALEYEDVTTREEYELAWYYGHFHQKWTWKYENTDFKMLDIMEFATIRITDAELE